MITGFILVSVLCLEGGSGTIAGVPAGKVSCSASSGEVFKSMQDCTARANTMTRVVREDYGNGYRELVISPGVACVHVNKKLSEKITYGTEVI
jgi:hypothetical protein